MKPRHRKSKLKKNNQQKQRNKKIFVKKDSNIYKQELTLN